MKATCRTVVVQKIYKYAASPDRILLSVRETDDRRTYNGTAPGAESHAATLVVGAITG